MAATCSGSPTAPSSKTGTVKATIQTTGSDQDPDGYSVTVDKGTPKHVPDNGTAIFTGVTTGSHSVVLDSVAPNCTVSGSNPRTLNVTAGDTTSTTFTVSCTAKTGALSVISSTSGSDPDSDGYAVVVDSGASRHLAVNDTLVIDSLAVGDHTVRLDSVASNCTISGSNPRTVSVVAQDTAPTTFTVSCSALTGDVKVTTSTTGSDLDPNGYAVSVDGGTSHHIAINDTLTLTGLATGSHSVLLDSVAANCTVTGGATQSVTVPDGGTAAVTFDISCAALTGDIVVHTSSSGTDLDSNGYSIALDGGTPASIGIDDSIRYDSLAAGDHTIQLGDVAVNCTVSGSNPMTVTAPNGGTADTTFAVSCAPDVGSVVVSNTTTGSNLDPDGYTVTVDGSTSQTMTTNGSVTFDSLATGTHTVLVTGLADNCALQGSNPDTVSVAFDSTADATFTIGCVAPLSGKIAFESTRTGSFQIYLMNTDGSNQVPLTNTTTNERLPAISPDGNRIAFQSDRSGAIELWIMLNDGSSPVRVTGAAAREPSWSPDGSAIAYSLENSAGTHIYTIHPDGTGRKLITDLSHTDTDPAWSPDGTRIAFVRDSLGNGEIYVIGAGGAGPATDLSQDSAGNDFNPAWSPDGSRIVFASDRNNQHGDIYVMPDTGGVQTRLTTDTLPDFAPTYSRDGTYIYFTSDRSGTSQIWRMTASCIASIASDPQACVKTLVQITNDGYKDDNASVSP